MVNADAIADWCDLPHRAEGAEAPSSPRGTFFAALGASGTTRPRVLAAISPEGFATVVNDWMIDGVRPSPVLSASAGLVGTVARLVCGLTPTSAEKQAAQAAELELLKAQAASSSKVGSQPRSIKLSTVVDQANDLEIEPMSSDSVESAYATYRLKMGDNPRPEEDVTPEQLAGLRALFASGAPPYVDLAIWGPFGRRIQKKLRLNGLILSSAGTLHQAQLYGPPNIEEWLAGFAVYRTGAIMLGQITPATLDLWVKVITNYAYRYGPEVWALIYQTDVRARLEHMERIRRLISTARTQAIEAGGSHAFDPAVPWEWVFRQTAEDVQFWRRELEEPTLLIKTRVEKLSASLQDDAPVQPGTGSSQRSGPAATPPPPKRQRVQADRDAPRVHRVDADGYFTHNRRGNKLCSLFQKGECSTTGSGRCSRDSYLVHQCAKCLFLGHGRSQCVPRSSAATTRPSAKAKVRERGSTRTEPTSPRASRQSR